MIRTRQITDHNRSGIWWRLLAALLVLFIGIPMFVPSVRADIGSLFNVITKNGQTLIQQNYPFETIDATALNNLRYVNKYPGATADVKIAACLAEIPGGGVCDARGFGSGNQTIAATITVNAHQTLLLDPATTFQAGSSSLDLFLFEPNAIINGFTFDCTNQPSYSGKLFKNDTNAFYTNGNKTVLRDITVNSSCAALTTGVPLSLNSTNVSKGVAFVKFDHWRIYGLADGVQITSSTGGFVNGNHFHDWVVSNSPHGIHVTNGGSAVVGNIFTEFSYEKDSTGTNCSLWDGAGAGTVAGNQIWGDCWDVAVSHLITNSSTNKNLFVGQWDGSHTDNSANGNMFWSLGPSSIAYYFGFQGLQAKVKGGGGISDALDLFDTTPAASNPHKYFRVNGGNLEIVNSAFSAVSFSMTDGGILSLGGHGVPQFLATLTSTAAASDNVSITGVVAGSKCNLTATNSTAATNIASTYISAKAANQITVTHPATAGMTYDITCSN